jgi:hypothetical protein
MDSAVPNVCELSCLELNIGVSMHCRSMNTTPDVMVRLLKTGMPVDGAGKVRFLRQNSHRGSQ